MSNTKRPEEYVRDLKDIIHSRLKNLAINRFQWSNLPPEMTSRKMEQYLIEHGKVFFHKNEEGAILALPAFGVSDYNVYGEPDKYNIVGYGYNRIEPADKGVVIRNNPLGLEDNTELGIFAHRLNEIEMTMDINLNGQKTPYVILCDEKQRLTFKNVFNQIMKFKYAIFGDNGLNTKSIEVLPTIAPFLLDKLQEAKIATMNEALTYLGINNTPYEKRERLITSEVDSNNQIIDTYLDMMYKERVDAKDKINAMFGYSIDVQKNVQEVKDYDNNASKRLD